MGMGAGLAPMYGTQPQQPAQVPAQVPAQGGKGGVQQPTQVPAQGGKGGVQQPGQPQLTQEQIAALGPAINYRPTSQVQQPTGPMPSYIADKYAEMERMRAGQPGMQQPQVPAQGGKTPFTPEQKAAFAPYIDAMPQVLPQQPNTYLPQVQQPQVLTQQDIMALPALGRPRPQVLPAQPQERGLGGLRNRGFSRFKNRYR